MSDDMGLSLSVTVPAGEWAELRRRLLYLEATLVQVMRDHHQIKEWFTAAELSDLRLPGLPATKNALTRAAREGGWRCRVVPCRGGERFEYHFSALPRRAFDALIERVLAGGADDDEGFEDVAPVMVPQLPMAEPPLVVSTGATAEPAWVLPLLRTIKREGAATIREAVELLPRYLPSGMACPSLDEVRAVLERLGMVS